MDYGYSTTSYGAQGGANGGGFMPGSQGEGSGNAKRSYGKDTLRPVTIKQLIEAHHPNPDAEHFMIDDNETTQVTFVGQVRNISTQTTNINYKLDDGTGIFEVKLWIDSDAMNSPESDQKPKPVEQGYARVWGRLKDFNSKRHVVANVVRPITDYNEVSFHLLEATAVHLYFTRGPPDQQQQGQQTNGGATSNGTTGVDGQSGLGSTSAAALATVGADARKVYQVLRQAPQTMEGLHVQDIAGRCSLELMSVQRACEELSNAGLVFTTYDESTFALLQLD